MSDDVYGRQGRTVELTISAELIPGYVSSHILVVKQPKKVFGGSSSPLITTMLIVGRWRQAHSVTVSINIGSLCVWRHVEEDLFVLII